MLMHMTLVHMHSERCTGYVLDVVRMMMHMLMSA
jgi:hypothetical protein